VTTVLAPPILRYAFQNEVREAADALPAHPS
jgi:hypothetical protein